MVRFFFELVALELGRLFFEALAPADELVALELLELLELTTERGGGGAAGGGGGGGGGGVGGSGRGSGLPNGTVGIAPRNNPKRRQPRESICPRPQGSGKGFGMLLMRPPFVPSACRSHPRNTRSASWKAGCRFHTCLRFVSTEKQIQIEASDLPPKR